MYNKPYGMSGPGMDDGEENDPGRVGTWIFALSLVALAACAGAMAYWCRCIELVFPKKRRGLAPRVGGKPALKQQLDVRNSPIESAPKKVQRCRDFSSP